jgi:hypothetical protein
MANITAENMNPKCELCDEELEKLGENHFSCKTCGIGTDGKEVDLKFHLKKITDMITTEIEFHPDLTNNQIADKVQDMLHKSEKHPLDRHNYCIYCHKSFKT